MKKIDQMLFRMILRSKGQFIAILAVIVTGVMIYASMNMAADNLSFSRDAYYARNNFADIFIAVKRIPFQEAEKLESMAGIRKAEGRISYEVPFIAEDPNERVYVKVISISDEKEGINSLTFLEGGPIQEPGREVILISQFAEARGIRTGDRIRIQMNGVLYNLSVAGIAASPEFIYLLESEQSMLPSPAGYGVAYIGESLAKSAFGLAGECNEILVTLTGDVPSSVLADDLEEALSSFGPERITERKDQLSHSMISMELVNLKKMAEALPLLFLAAAGLVLVMMLSRAVKADRNKIGVLKAMGYSDGAVYLHYIKYSVAAGVGGGLLGTLLGMLLSGGMTGLYAEFFEIPDYAVAFNGAYILFAILLAVLFCAGSGLYGARGVLKIRPAEAMQPIAPKAGGRILPERYPFLWNRLSFSRKLILRNVFRNKKRAALVLAGVAMTYSMVFFSLSMWQVADDMLNKHFSEFMTMDYNVDFAAPMDNRALYELSGLLPDSVLEPKIEFPFILTRVNREKTVNIIGVQRDTEFYSFTDRKGNPVKVTENRILLTENLAKAIGAEKGDSVEIRSFLPGGNTVSVEVGGVIRQAMGMNAYMEVRSMGKELLEPDLITGALIDTKDPEASGKLRLTRGISSVFSSREIRDSFSQYLSTMFLSIGIMVAFSGVLGFSVVYNATIVSVSEREREFSSLRVLGFGKNEIFRMVLRENNMLSLGGILAGIPLGLLFLSYSSEVFSTELYTIRMSPTPPAAIGAAFATGLFILAAQLLTYRKVSGLDFLQALKNRE